MVPWMIAMIVYEVTAQQARTIDRTCIGHYQKPVRPRDMVSLATAILKLQSGSEPKRSPLPRQFSGVPCFLQVHDGYPLPEIRHFHS